MVCTSHAARTRVHNHVALDTKALRSTLERALRFNDGEENASFARAFCLSALKTFWKKTCAEHDCSLRLPECPDSVGPLPEAAKAFAHAVGSTAASLSFSAGAYTLSSLYVQMLPDLLRAQYGMYFTPPPVVERLLDMVTESGFDWTNGKIIDPACGGGAFLAPVASRMIKHALAAHRNPNKEALARDVCSRLRGIEIESFCAWMAKVFLQLTVIDLLGCSDILPHAVCTGDAMTVEGRLNEQFDLVIGNPPYGKVSLPPGLRKKYARSLYGHANLYGIFTDMAVCLAKRDGLIAYVTPTSFLGGQYFRNLRKLLREEAPPRAIDFVTNRDGVFADVLQETSLAVYRRGRRDTRVSVSVTTPGRLELPAEVARMGKFRINGALDSPWILPRDAMHATLLGRAQKMNLHLADLGYQVSTGPLVWNRHKKQLAQEPGRGNLPLIWAESVQADGKFRFAYAKRNHVPYFHLQPEQDHLITKTPCVLVQRTTAKEQHRRIIAARLPYSFVQRHGGVVIENHLNVVRPANGRAVLDLVSLAALLNSTAIDELFRCISGSVAVSAYEIESMPLPSEDDLAVLQQYVQSKASPQKIDDFISSLYGVLS